MVGRTVMIDLLKSKEKGGQARWARKIRKEERRAMVSKRTSIPSSNKNKEVEKEKKAL